MGSDGLNRDELYCVLSRLQESCVQVSERPDAVLGRLGLPAVGVLEMGKLPVETTKPEIIAFTTKPELIAFKLAQYAALRDEILKRLEMQHQLIALALVASSALIPIGLCDKGPEMILWLSPILIMFIAIAWSWNNVRIVQAGKFIKDRIEGNDDWEHYWRASDIHTWLTRRCLTGVIAASSIFIGAQLLILILASARFGRATEEKVMVFIDIAIVLLTGGILWSSEDRNP